MPTKTGIYAVVILFLLMAVTGAALHAEDQPSEGATESVDSAESAALDSQDAEDSSKQADANEASAPAGDSVAGQMGEVTLEKFVPSEEISADGAVSFPVDI